MYKYIVFDIDGTLMDTEKAILCALRKLLKIEKNRTYTAEELHFILGIPGHEALRMLEVENPDEALSRWDDYLGEYMHHISIFPDIEKTLQQLLAKNIKTGIVTSKTRHEYEKDFIPFGLTRYFQHVVCASDTRHHKPHPEPLQLCLELAGALPGEALYIGDTIYDSQCAAGAGVDFALALWGTRNKNIPSAYKPENPMQILDLLHIQKPVNNF